MHESLAAPVKAPSTARSVLWFLVVGGSSAAVHYLVALLMLWHWGHPPWLPLPTQGDGARQALMANLAAFSVAFWVSYAGHYRLSFQSRQPHRQALPRFFLIAFLGFLGNQALYALLLGLAHWPPFLALATTLVLIAVGTFLLSRRLAFKPGLPAQ